MGIMFLHFTGSNIYHHIFTTDPIDVRIKLSSIHIIAPDNMLCYLFYFASIDFRIEFKAFLFYYPFSAFYIDTIFRIVKIQVFRIFCSLEMVFFN